MRRITISASKLTLAAFAAALIFFIPVYANATPVNGFPTVTSVSVDGYVSLGVVQYPTLPTVEITLPKEYRRPDVPLSGNWSYACDTCSGYGVSASGSARVVGGTLGASATVAVTGTPPSPNYQVMGLSNAGFYDFLTIAGGNGSGVLHLTYTIHGSISQTGNGFNHSHADLYPWMDCDQCYVSVGSNAPTKLGPFGLGVTVTSDAVANFWLPFTFGTQMPLFFRLEAEGIFHTDDDTTPYTATAGFYSTATLTSALVYDGGATDTGLDLGSLLPDATISSRGGFTYGPNGLSAIAVPAPGTLPLLAFGLGLLFLMLTRTRIRGH